MKIDSIYIIDLHEDSQDAIEETQKPPYGWLMEDILTYKMDTYGQNQEVEAEIQKAVGRSGFVERRGR
jgi:hypothetical protein